MTSKVSIRRVYEAPAESGTYRVLVDRIWPRGVSKERLLFDVWAKELAPSPALRKWFCHKDEHWPSFHQHYLAELRSPEQTARLRALYDAAQGRPVVLLYAAKDEQHNHAVILAEELNRLY